MSFFLANRYSDGAVLQKQYNEGIQKVFIRES